MTEPKTPMLIIQDEVILKGKEGVKIVCIMDPLVSADLKETVEFLIETGLSKAEKMKEGLQIIEELLLNDGRFRDIAAEMKCYRETVFSRGTPFTMIEARAIMRKLEKWLTVIERRSEHESSVGNFSMYRDI
jgi:hypothetical protein